LAEVYDDDTHYTFASEAFKVCGRNLGAAAYF